MSDSIALIVGKRRLEKFISYRVEADFYCADNYFRLELGSLDTDIDGGMRCELRVNDRPALQGIIDRITDADEKRGTGYYVEGRDLMGLLVDSYVESYPDRENIALKELAEQLIATVPYISRQDIQYQAGLAGAAASGTKDSASDAMAALGIGQKNCHVEPGSTIFEELKRAAMSRGAMFFGLPDGTFVFGRPKASGEAFFTIVHNRRGAGNNAFRSTRVRDVSRKYSKIVVVGQQQGDDLLQADEINIAATVTDDTAPFYKPFVATLNDDSVSPQQYARMLLEMQRAAALQLIYSVRGHSQQGRNWTINELCRVRDEVRGIDGVYLIVSRAFELSKQNGVSTEIRLSLPGVIQ
ncbi:MAG: hypothetical protein M0036_04680 [Desulfobacteraceae bacterium]|nr:hypothetical protein [Desulfobacteraceae bacterium]